MQIGACTFGHLTIDKILSVANLHSISPLILVFFYRIRPRNQPTFW